MGRKFGFSFSWKRVLPVLSATGQLLRLTWIPFTAPTLLTIILSVGLPVTSFADWPGNPLTNLAVCFEPELQAPSAIVPDGSGGAIVVWIDGRSTTTYETYAQHILSSGQLDPDWSPTGLLVTTASGTQSWASAVSDLQGGAIVAWQDERDYSSTGIDLYAHHILASGALDPLWPAEGLPVAVGEGGQVSVVLVPDGAGGALAVWANYESWPSPGTGVQHILLSGSVDPSWPDSGLTLGPPGNGQYNQVACSDSAGGILVAWHEGRNNLDYDILAQHVLANGQIDPDWPVTGLTASGVPGDQVEPAIVADGAGGAIIVWTDERAGYDVYGQHIRASGDLDPAWPPTGAIVSMGLENASTACLVADGTGGALVSWTESGVTPNQVYAMRITAAGVPGPGWPANGKSVAPSASDQYLQSMISDGTSGALLFWQEARGGSGPDIYAQRILLNSHIHSAWTVGGTPVSTAINNQWQAIATTDGAHGAIATWQDFRAAGESDVYAQRVDQFGVIGSPTVDVPGAREVDVAIASLSPVPFQRGSMIARVTLASTAPAELSVFDVRGRQVYREAISARLGGSETRIARSVFPAAGVYMLVLRQAADAAMAKVVVLP